MVLPHMWVYRPVLCARCLLCSPPLWQLFLLFSVHQLNDSYGVPSAPQHTDTRRRPLPSDLVVHTLSLPALQRSSEHTPVPPPLCFHFLSWRPWCVISHKLTMLHTSYLRRSPSPVRACHDNQYFSLKTSRNTQFFPSFSASLSFTLPKVKKCLFVS